jgi:post-segregation antitoxin (ccd killing protein)
VEVTSIRISTFPYCASTGKVLGYFYRDRALRVPLYDNNAKRKTVSVTLNANLVARSAAHGINISRVAETALITAFEAAEKVKIRDEIREAARFTDEIVRRYGHPFPESRAMLMPDDEDADNLSDDAA